MSLLSQTGIPNFYDAARRHDFSRKFQFRILQIGDARYTDDLMQGIVYMTTAKVPGRSITNKAVPYMGLDFNVPGTAKYDGSADYNVRFRLPQNFLTRNTFEKWNFNIFNDETSTGDYSIPCPNSILEMALINNKGNSIRQYRLIGVYCKSIGELEYDVTDDGSIVEFDATLAYQYWRPVTGDGFDSLSGTEGLDTVTGIYDAYQEQAAGSDLCADKR